MSSRHSTLLLVSQLQGELDRVLGEAARSRELAEPDWHAADAPPPVDVMETEEKLVITVEVPGLEADDLEIRINGHELRLRGRRRPKGAFEGNARFLCMERNRGVFERFLWIDDTVDPAGARARLARGLLTIEVPRLRERRAGHHVPIDVED